MFVFVVFVVSLDILDSKCHRKRKDRYRRTHSLKTFKNLSWYPRLFSVSSLVTAVCCKTHTSVCQHEWGPQVHYWKYTTNIKACFEFVTVICSWCVPRTFKVMCTPDSSLLQFIKYNCKDHLEEALKSHVHSKKRACIILYYIYLRAFSCIFFSIANKFVPVTPRWLACKYDGTQNLLYLSVCHSMFFSWGCFFSMSLQRKEGPEGPPGEMGRTGIPVYSFLT